MHPSLAGRGIEGMTLATRPYNNDKAFSGKSLLSGEKVAQSQVARDMYRTCCKPCHEILCSWKERSILLPMSRQFLSHSNTDGGEPA